jgi:hypothetical protein
MLWHRRVQSALDVASGHLALLSRLRQIAIAFLLGHPPSELNIGLLVETATRALVRVLVPEL